MHYCLLSLQKQGFPLSAAPKNILSNKMDLISSNNGSRRTVITDIHQEIIEAHILSRLDGPTLASTACASQQLHALCTIEKVWTKICNSTWTSTKHPLIQHTISTFPGGHRSFFSDSFPVLHHGDSRNRHGGHPSIPLQTSELISAVDIHYKNKLLYSKVDVTNNYYRDSTFRVELIGKKESVRMPVKYEDDEDVYLSDLKEYMTLSWIVIDPTPKRAANVSSLRPVSVRPHWIEGDIEVKYATVVDGDCGTGRSELVELRIVVKLGWKEEGELEMRKVNLQVQGMDGNFLSGKESSRILQEAIKCGKRQKGKRGEEAEIYRRYVDMKREKREGKLRRRGSTVLIPAAIFTIFLVLVLLGFFGRGL